jgi:hypothetical protein
MLRGAPLPSGGRALSSSDCGIFQEILELALDTPPSVVDGSGYRCTFGPGLMGRPEARKKKHGPGTARYEIF